MEQNIGEIFEYNGEWYQCVEGVDITNCSDCDIQRYCVTVKPENIGRCLQWRSDKKKAIFKKLKKVGEPYMSDGHLMQTLSGEKQPNSIRDYKTRMCYYSNCLLRIEIKQNKENMEEKKLNLKPFDLQKAKEGNPVCTRDGRKARILCYDFKQNEEYPILVAVENKDGKECALLYSNDGISEMYKSSNNELAILPKKKEGWLNVYKERCYETKEEAISCRACNMECIDTIKVEWEE